MKSQKVAVVAGVGEGLGAALCKKLLSEGYSVAGLSRRAKPYPSLGNKYRPLVCDISQKSSINEAISTVENTMGDVNVYIHNAATLIHSPFLELTDSAFTDIWNVCCLGAANGIQRVLPNMLEKKEGTIIVTGATASVKAGANFSAFASAKFALRGLTQSLAREFGPQGIHIAHVILDGAVWGKQAEQKFGRKQYDCIDPNAIADAYYYLIQQHRSAWTQELDLRPDIESF